MKKNPKKPREDLEIKGSLSNPVSVSFWAREGLGHAEDWEGLIGLPHKKTNLWEWLLTLWSQV